MAISKWNKSPLKLLCYRIGDGLHGTPQYDENSDIMFINGNNLKNGNICIFEDTKKVSSEVYKNNYIELNEESLLLSINGTIGNMAFYSDEKVMLGKSAAYLNFKTKINQFYYYYFQLKEVQQYFYNVATGSTIKNLGLKTIQDFEVPSPDEEDWQPIAKILSDFDKKIELNNKINTELEAMAKLVYDYWFVQFDFPDANGKPYKSSGGKMVYNEALKRKIPDGWAIEELFDISNITTGKLDSNAEVVGGGYPFYTCAKAPVTIDSYQYDGDVILIAGNNASGNFHVNRYSGKFNAYQRTYIVTAKEELHLNYLYQVLTRQMKIYKNRGKGSQTKFLTIGMLTEIQIFHPNTNLMSKFHKLTAQLYEKQMIILRENKELESLRDWLLPMLMNGQVTVKD